MIKIIQHKERPIKTPPAIWWVQEEKSIVIIIPSYNNEEYVGNNLTSVLKQEYTNYRVIFIDDCSTDGTKALALEYVETLQGQDKVTFVHNEKNYKALYNLYYSIQSLYDEEIVVVLDGDDWFAHPRVLKEINRYYSDPNVWMTYGQHITYPEYEKGGGCVSRLTRKQLDENVMFPQPRTFYAGLFKKIKMKDLVCNGGFFTASADLAVMTPLWEMAKEHAVFIPDVMYVYNRETPRNDDKIHREEQLRCNQYIQSLPSYEKLEDFRKGEKGGGQSTLCVFSENRPLQLLCFLESIEQRGEGFSPIHVFYTSKEEAYEKGYSIVKERFDQKVVFHKWQGGEFLTHLPGEYITFAKDTFIVNCNIDVRESIKLLEKTGAYAVYFDLGLNVEDVPKQVLALGENAFIWDFSLAKKGWALCNRLDMTLYKKEKILPYLNKIRFQTMQEFENQWKQGVDLYQVGLFFKESKAINVPLQITKLDTQEQTLLYTEQELNDRLLEGYKIDLSPVADLQIHSSKIEFYPQFLKRL